MKIDTSKIEGYDTLSAEEKLSALEAYEIEDNSEEITKLKSTISKVNSENAKYKRQLESQKNETDPEIANLKEEIATLKREKTVSSYQAQFIKQGYEDELALSTATALADGDTETVLRNQSAFLAEFEKKIKATQLMNTPKPVGGQPSDKKYTKEEFRKLTLAERMAYAESNPDEYKTIYGG